jgi:toxin-antitoxin system PIN domain toxin
VNRPVLLDVNILVALFDPAHVHHELAHDWFGDNRHRGWATTPITENAVLRIFGNPKYGSNAERPELAAPRLHAFCSADDHLFWPAAISLADSSRFHLAFASHRQLTDVYLLGLAQANGGALSTFDRSIPIKAVAGATPDLLEVITE